MHTTLRPAASEHPRQLSPEGTVTIPEHVPCRATCSRRFHRADGTRIAFAGDRAVAVEGPHLCDSEITLINGNWENRWVIADAIEIHEGTDVRSTRHPPRLRGDAPLSGMRGSERKSFSGLRRESERDIQAKGTEGRK